MFLTRVVRYGFKPALDYELGKRGMTIRELAKRIDVSPATLYKISCGDRDPRLSLLTAISHVFEPSNEHSIAIIAAKFLLDEVAGKKIDIDGIEYLVKGYTANTVDECIISAVRAEKEGASGIICAPILSSLIERLVDVPVVSIRPGGESYIAAIEVMTRQLNHRD
jgi:predicted transcriptional regulator